jgi:nucleotide-binding universal stress UspA family protein
MTTPHPVRRDARSLQDPRKRSGEVFDNVVVGVDDPQAGRDALELARELIAADGNMMLVYVQVVVPAADSDSDPVWQVAERRRALERLASLRDEARVDAQLSCVQARSVAVGLHEAVRRHGDLLVIGASQRDEYERTFVGDDTREVLKDPPSAVAVAPTGYAMRAPALRKIGVAYDGSPGSEQALAVARTLARDRHAELSAFEAVPEPIRVHDVWNVEGEIEADVAKARERLGALGEVDPSAASGDAAEELARYAPSVDLLVLGPHRHRPIDLLMGGSTSQRLAESAPCALLVLGPAGGSSTTPIA